MAEDDLVSVTGQEQTTESVLDSADHVFSTPAIDAAFVLPNGLARCAHFGIHTFSVEEAKMRIADGSQFIAINGKLRFLMDGAKRAVDRVGIQRKGEMVKY